MKSSVASLEELLDLIWDNPVGNDLFFFQIATLHDDHARFLEQNFQFSIEGYYFIIDNFAIRHIKKRHGDAITEISRGQVSIQKNDFYIIPEILRQPDNIELQFERNKHFIILKKIENGLEYTLVTEVRSPKRKLICIVSFRIKKADHK